MDAFTIQCMLTRYSNNTIPDFCDTCPAFIVSENYCELLDLVWPYKPHCKFKVAGCREHHWNKLVLEHV